MSEKSKKVLGKTKRIKDATLIAKPPKDVEEFQKKWFEQTETAHNEWTENYGEQDLSLIHI